MTSAFSWQNCLPLTFFILYSNQLYFSKKKKLLITIKIWLRWQILCYIYAQFLKKSNLHLH